MCWKEGTLNNRSASSIAPDATNHIFWGDARAHLASIKSGSIDLSFWSPPYFVGKSYEAGWSFEEWANLLQDVMREHIRIIKPGAFMAINIGDILCFPDSSIPRFQVNNVRGKKVKISREEILAMKNKYPNAS